MVWLIRLIMDIYKLPEDIGLEDFCLLVILVTSTIVTPPLPWSNDYFLSAPCWNDKFSLVWKVKFLIPLLFLLVKTFTWKGLRVILYKFFLFSLFSLLFLFSLFSFILSILFSFYFFYFLFSFYSSFFLFSLFSLFFILSCHQSSLHNLTSIGFLEIRYCF